MIVPLTYLTKFWRSTELSLIKCEIELDLRWTRNLKICEISRTSVATGDNTVEATTAPSATFQINNVDLYVFLVTLSINDNIMFLEHQRSKDLVTMTLQ